LRRKKQQKGPPNVIADAEVVATPIQPLMSNLPFIARSISLFHRVWPVSGLMAAIVVNVAWIGFLGYGFFKLVGPAFF
jgi:hypothetical protein